MIQCHLAGCKIRLSELNEGAYEIWRMSAINGRLGKYIMIYVADQDNNVFRTCVSSKYPFFLAEKIRCVYAVWPGSRVATS